MRAARLLSAVAIAVGVFLVPLATGASGANPSTLVVIGGTLIDGTGREPVPDATIIIEDGKILAVGAGMVSIADGAERIDARGKWIVPCLIDMHVHYQDWMDPLFVSHGVTTVRIHGGPGGLRRAPGAERPGAAAGGALPVDPGAIEGPSVLD